VKSFFINKFKIIVVLALCLGMVAGEDAAVCVMESGAPCLLQVPSPFNSEVAGVLKHDKMLIESNLEYIIRPLSRKALDLLDLELVLNTSADKKTRLVMDFEKKRYEDGILTLPCKVVDRSAGRISNYRVKISPTGKIDVFHREEEHAESEKKEFSPEDFLEEGYEFDIVKNVRKDIGAEENRVIITRRHQNPAVGSNVAFLVIPELKTIVVEVFYPNFRPSKGKGRALLKYLLNRPQYEGYHIIGTATAQSKRAFASIPEFDTVVDDRGLIARRMKEAFEMPIDSHSLRDWAAEHPELIEYLRKAWGNANSYGRVPCQGGPVVAEEREVSPAGNVKFDFHTVTDTGTGQQKRIVRRPLDQIGPNNVKNILVYLGRKSTFPKLGETVMDVWPLVSGLMGKYKHSKIYVVSGFPELFKPGMFDGRVEAIHYKDFAFEKRIETFEWVENFVKERDITMIFDLSIVPVLHRVYRNKYVGGKDKSSGALPYVFGLFAPTTKLSAYGFDGYPGDMDYSFISPDAEEYYVDSQDKESRDWFYSNIMTMEKSVIGSKTGTIAGGWLISIQMCRLLGLDIDAENLPSVMPTALEVARGLHVLEGIYNRSNRYGCRFDPNKKIVIVNVYAVTQLHRVSEGEWVHIIAEIIKKLKNSYIVFTHGGEMDELGYLDKVIKGVRQRLNEEGFSNGNEIVLPRTPLYPVIHDILYVTSAVVTLDTGFSHLASGVHNVPSAIITSPAIYHWLTPRKNIVPISVSTMTDMFHLGIRNLYLDENVARSRMLENVRIFLDSLAAAPERPFAKVAKLAAASAKERAELDDKLIKATAFECPGLEAEIKRFLGECLDFFWLTYLFVPERVVFVDSGKLNKKLSEEMGDLEIPPRFRVKLYKPKPDKVWLLVDRSALEEDKDGRFSLRESIKEIDILHEIFGHRMARQIFPKFDANNAEAEKIEDIGSVKDRDFYERVMVLKAKEEIISWVLTFMAMQEISKSRPDIIGNDVRSRVSEFLRHVEDMEIGSLIDDVVLKMEHENVLSVLRYKEILEDELRTELIKSELLKNYMPRMQKMFRKLRYQAVKRKEEKEALDASGGMAAKKEKPFLKDIRVPDALGQCLVQSAISHSLSKKTVLAFESGLGGVWGDKAFALISELERLKNDPKYGHLLKNLIIVRRPSDKLGKELAQYRNDGGSEIFMFARESEKAVLNNVAGGERFHKVYINEKVNGKDFPVDAYYPLVEMVTITLASFLDEKALEDVSKIIADLNIGGIEEKDGALIFTLLPHAEAFGGNDPAERCAAVRRCLRSV